MHKNGTNYQKSSMAEKFLKIKYINISFERIKILIIQILPCRPFHKSLSKKDRLIEAASELGTLRVEDLKLMNGCISKP